LETRDQLNQIGCKPSECSRCSDKLVSQWKGYRSYCTAGGSRGRFIGDIQQSGFTHAVTSTEFHASLISGDLYSRKTEGFAVLLLYVPVCRFNVQLSARIR